MACALRLSQLIDEHKRESSRFGADKGQRLRPRKGARGWAALPFGALLDPRSMKELLPGFESEAPLMPRSRKSGLFSKQGQGAQVPCGSRHRCAITGTLVI